LKYIKLINEFQKKDIDFIKEIGNIFTISVEYEICANENPEDEPPVDDVDDVIYHIKEKTLLDMKRGKAASYKYDPSKTDFDEKEVKRFIDDTLNNIFLFIEAEESGEVYDYPDMWKDWENYDDYVLDYVLNPNNYDDEVEIRVIEFLGNNFLVFNEMQNIKYLIDKVKENLPKFYKKYHETFKYELEGDAGKQRILEFSPKTYLNGLDDAFEQINLFFDEFEKQDYWYFNERTALHVNIGVNKKVKINPLKGLILMSDMDRDKKIPYVFKNIGHRMNNRFVGSMIDGLFRLLSGDIYKDLEHPDPIYRLNTKEFRNWKELKKYKGYLKKNIESLDMHDIPKLEDFLNTLLIKSNTDFYLKEFGLNIAYINKSNYVEFRFVGGNVSRELLLDKLIYFCYLFYSMTDPEYKKQSYHKRLYKFVDRIKSYL
jgi:hypothetical protein